MYTPTLVSQFLALVTSKASLWEKRTKTSGRNDGFHLQGLFMLDYKFRKANSKWHKTEKHTLNYTI